MDSAVKAALLSGLVFPGAGQLFLKRPQRACLFMLPALAASAYFLYQVVGRALAMTRLILDGSLPADPFAIIARLRQNAPDPTLMNIAVWTIVACWLGSTVDAWWLGRRRADVKQKT